MIISIEIDFIFFLSYCTQVYSEVVPKVLDTNTGGSELCDDFNCFISADREDCETSCALELKDILDLGFDTYKVGQKCSTGTASNIEQYVVDRRPKTSGTEEEKKRANFSSCAHLCKKNHKCQFFFYNSVSYCEMYDTCDNENKPTNNGSIYQKREKEEMSTDAVKTTNKTTTEITISTEARETSTTIPTTTTTTLDTDSTLSLLDTATTYKESVSTNLLLTSATTGNTWKITETTENSDFVMYAGIGGGVGIAIVAILIIVIFMNRRKKKTSKDDHEENDYDPTYDRVYSMKPGGDTNETKKIQEEKIKVVENPYYGSDDLDADEDIAVRVDSVNQTAAICQKTDNPYYESS